MKSKLKQDTKYEQKVTLSEENKILARAKQLFPSALKKVKFGVTEAISLLVFATAASQIPDAQKYPLAYPKHSLSEYYFRFKLSGSSEEISEEIKVLKAFDKQIDSDLISLTSNAMILNERFPEQNIIEENTLFEGIFKFGNEISIRKSFRFPREGKYMLPIFKTDSVLPIHFEKVYVDGVPLKVEDSKRIQQNHTSFRDTISVDLSEGTHMIMFSYSTKKNPNK